MVSSWRPGSLGSAIAVLTRKVSRGGYAVWLCAITLLVAGCGLGLERLGATSNAAQRVDFNAQIRPILNQNCTSCHGGVMAAGGVSFVFREAALGVGASGRPVIVPGNPNASEMIARVTTDHVGRRMPLNGPPLSEAQIQLLRTWIRQGANWEDHWAFVPPKRQVPPKVATEGWTRQPLDRFVLATLERKGLQPSPEAGRAELLRRVSLDLVGLPPTPAEIAAFVADKSPDAYEKQVDRLLASPRYGERWASVWLDLARYADSRGLMINYPRASWPYRDWLIDAYNRNLPYDRFVITQLAGDLLPNATIDDLIATAFNRQTSTNDEGGSDDEEFRQVAVMDRVATTWSVLNGVTMNCVQCHSHPYDPIRHHEYYQFMAFFNTTRDADLPDDHPVLPIPPPAGRDAYIRDLRRRETLLREAVGENIALARQSTWSQLPIVSGRADEAEGLRRYMTRLRKVDPRLSELSYMKELLVETQNRLDRTRGSSAVIPLKIQRGEVAAGPEIPAESLYELATSATSGRVTALRIEVPPTDPKTARHTPDDGFMIERVEAWTIGTDGSERAVRFRMAPDTEEDLLIAVREARRPSRGAGSLRLQTGGFAADSKLSHTRWLILVPEEPLPAGARLKLRLTHTQAIAREADAYGPAPVDTTAGELWAASAQLANYVAKAAAATSSNAGKPTLARRVRLMTSADPRWSSAVLSERSTSRLWELAEADGRIAKVAAVPVPIMSEQPLHARRQTLVFHRGNMVEKKGEPLTADVPKLLPPLPKGAPRNRLSMARWFFAPEQPLTSRVAVNRYWEQLFGTGIVETLEDFGSVGQPPSHPELLDYLALRFQQDLRWDQKALLRELVTSATYRQSAATRPDLLKSDPRNRLLARGPQQRLTAEMVRDQALLASGLLNTAMGGPAVMPPQPSAADPRWVESAGRQRYRRAVYTHLQRGNVYASFATFDASPHEVSLARRIPTNTPLQALVTLNDPAYVEASQALADRMLEHRPASNGDEPLQARLNHGGQRVLSRDLTDGELARLGALYRDLRHKERRSERDAMAGVAGVLLNLDAALNR
jgi:hypothetical protein